MSFRQLHVGRDETILEPDLPIIDAHHHLFLRQAIRYLFDDFLADVNSGHRIVASVYVEAHGMVRPDGPVMMRPLGEIEFANGAGAMAASGFFGECRICAAIVGYADLRFGDELGDYLDRALERAPERLRGIRQVMIEDPTGAAYRFVPIPPPSGVMQHPNFESGFRQLAQRGLSFDAAVFHPQLSEVAALAAAFPDTTIVINHTGHALALDLDADGRERVFVEWRKQLRAIARYPNVCCKIGGLGLPFWGFRFEERTDPIGYLELADAWRPYVETAIEAFGAERCMMESDYPPDSRSCGYVPLWNALKHIVRSASRVDKAALFHGTAARVYRIELPPL